MALEFPPVGAELMVQVDSVSVSYDVYEEPNHASLKATVARGFKRAPRRRVDAVRQVSFSIYRGEAVGLIGLNGSGKSSLLRAVTGVVPIDRGRIVVRSDPVLLGVGAALHPELTGRRNVYLGGTALGMSRRDVRERLDEIVRFAGVEDHIDLPLRTYSAGMNARLRFAIAAALEPEILLVDEALAVGDAEFRKRAERRMRHLVKNAGALVLVSHNSASIAEFCQRVIWLHDGIIRRDGPAAEVLEEYRAFATG